MEHRSSPGLLNAHLYVFLLREVEFRGFDPAPLLRRCGLTWAEITGFGAGIPTDRGIRLLRLLLDETDDPAIGLRAGTRAELADLDLAGMMLRASADVSAAVDVFARMMQTAGSIYSTQIVQAREGVAIRYVPPLGDATPRTLHDLFLSGSYALAREVLGPFSPLEVRSMQPVPEQVDVYAQVFGVPVTFDSPTTELLVPAPVAQRFAHSDSTLVRVIEPHVEQQFVRVHHTADMHTRVRHVLMAELSRGPLSITQVADRLGIGARTLRRHLHGQGTTFQNILDQTKHELALQRLRETPTASGTQISGWLGYTEPPAFYRAFKRWTGVSFTHYRLGRRSPSSNEV